MRISGARFGIFALASLVALGAKAANDENRSSWVVSGRDGSCAMLRPYDRSNPTWVVFGRDVEGRQFIRVHDDRWKVIKGKEYPATLTLDGVETVLTSHGAITDGARHTSGFTAHSTVDWQSKLATASRMTVKIPGNADAVIDLSDASAALAAMIECTKRAKADGEVLLRSRPKVIANLTLSPSDFSDLGSIDVAGKEVAIRLLIDKSGKPKRCDVVASSGATAVDSRTCMLAEARMRFLPAVASDGNPAEASFQFRIKL